MYTRNNITRLLLLALLLVLHSCNNTDSNKLVVFSGIALYYGESHNSMVKTTILHPQDAK